MYILTMIRKNIAGLPDYISTAVYTNGRTMTFKTERDAMTYYKSMFANSETFPVYGALAIHIPD